MSDCYEGTVVPDPIQEPCGNTYISTNCVTIPTQSTCQQKTETICDAFSRHTAAGTSLNLSPIIPPTYPSYIYSSYY